MAQDAGVDILNTLKKNRKDFFGEKRPKRPKDHQWTKHDKKHNYLIINESSNLDHPVDKDQKWSFLEKSNNPEKNRTISEGETFCGSFDHFIKKMLVSNSKASLQYKEAPLYNEETVNNKKTGLTRC